MHRIVLGHWPEWVPMHGDWLGQGWGRWVRCTRCNNLKKVD